MRFQYLANITFHDRTRHIQRFGLPRPGLSREFPSTFGNLVFLADLRYCTVDRSWNCRFEKNKSTGLCSRNIARYSSSGLDAQMVEVEEYLKGQSDNCDAAITRLIHSWIDENFYER